jgi:hypothetical protein
MDAMKRGGGMSKRSDSVQYAEQLEAHMDAGGSYTTANVRDLIEMIKSQDRLMEKDK